jgi:hypothetical protein
MDQMLSWAQRQSWMILIFTRTGIWTGGTSNLAGTHRLWAVKVDSEDLRVWLNHQSIPSAAFILP